MAEVVNTIERVTGINGLVEAEDDAVPVTANLTDSALQKDYGPFDYLTLQEGLGQTLRFVGRRACLRSDPAQGLDARSLAQAVTA